MPSQCPLDFPRLGIPRKLWGILDAAGFRPFRERGLTGGPQEPPGKAACRQDCLPHKCGKLHLAKLSGIWDAIPPHKVNQSAAAGGPRSRTYISHGRPESTGAPASATKWRPESVL